MVKHHWTMGCMHQLCGLLNFMQKSLHFNDMVINLCILERVLMFSKPKPTDLFSANIMPLCLQKWPTGSQCLAQCVFFLIVGTYYFMHNLFQLHRVAGSQFWSTLLLIFVLVKMPCANERAKRWIQSMLCHLAFVWIPVVLWNTFYNKVQFPCCDCCIWCGVAVVAAFNDEYNLSVSPPTQHHHHTLLIALFALQGPSPVYVCITSCLCFVLMTVHSKEHTACTRWTLCLCYS